MITKEKLQIYQRFDGDMDGFSRGANLSEKDSITDQDWRLIDELVQSLTIIQAGLASSDFEAQVRVQISAAVHDELAEEYFLQLSKPSI